MDFQKILTFYCFCIKIKGMETYIFDKRKIEALISDFYISTGIPITLYDINQVAIASSGVHIDYCVLIKNTAERRRLCRLYDLQHIERAKETRDSVYYTCHAGNKEVITPIFYEDTIIAYLQIGQFRMCSPTYEDALILLDLGCTNFKRMHAALNDIPIVSKQKLTSLQNILNIIIKSFWEDGLITRKRSMLSVKIEQYILENISQKIYIDELCSRFNVSRNSLYELFYNEFGVAINEFMIIKRIEYAKELLRNSDKSVSEISCLCGFIDYNYFIRIFKTKCDITPLKYRKMFEK